MFKTSLIAGVAAIAFALSAAPSMAQDWTAAPTYGNVQLTTGFQPDPYEVAVRSGGPIDSSQTLGGACQGFIASAPDFDLYYTAGTTFPLAISVASDSDVTLVVHAPDGNWYCDDDSGGGLNPVIEFGSPMSGLYDIWVGTYANASLQESTLRISELTHY